MLVNILLLELINMVTSHFYLGEQKREHLILNFILELENPA